MLSMSAPSGREPADRGARRSNQGVRECAQLLPVRVGECVEVPCRIGARDMPALIGLARCTTEAEPVHV